MAVYTYNEKIIYDDDGWGYCVTEGDTGEVIVKYFENARGGPRQYKEEMRLYTGVGELVAKAILEKFQEMELQNGES